VQAVHSGLGVAAQAELAGSAQQRVARAAAIHALGIQD